MNDKIYKILSYKIVIIIMLFVVITLPIILQCFFFKVTTTGQKYYQDKIEIIKANLTKDILNNKSQIDSLNNVILKQKIQEIKYQHTIDSLKLQKSKTQIKYQMKYLEALQYTPLKTFNYWTHKFKK